ncbi:MAG: alanine/glycine:cation symporter family protein, partial [Bacilli bacterium]
MLQSLENFINSESFAPVRAFVGSINDFLWSQALIILLIGFGLYFTFKMGFVQFRLIKDMFKSITEKSASPDGKKGVSGFGAFAVSTASRVGTGNMAGVATAIVAGGPGAVFWMWLIAIIGSASSFVESTLAQVYKEKNGDTFIGGPAYYMQKALNMRWLGVIFAVLITICFGFIFNALQSNTISAAFQTAFSFKAEYIGYVLIAVTGMIIFGGIKRIVTFAQIIIPIMAGIYILVAFLVTLLNVTELPAMFADIISSAFTFEQATGGIIGYAMMNGIKRGLFSNEAGMGSAPNVAATASVSHPVKQGLIQTFGVFIDTIIICSATAFIVLLSGTYTNYDSSNVNGIEVTQSGLQSLLGDWAPIFIAGCILLFAFTSIIGNYYYGEANIRFITEKKIYLNVYRILVLAWVMFGTLDAIGFIWDLADLFMGLMAIINLYAIFRLAPIAKEALDDYMVQRKAGKDPMFYADTIKKNHGISAWPERE